MVGAEKALFGTEGVDTVFDFTVFPSCGACYPSVLLCVVTFSRVPCHQSVYPPSGSPAVLDVLVLWLLGQNVCPHMVPASRGSQHLSLRLLLFKKVMCNGFKFF